MIRVANADAGVGRRDDVWRGRELEEVAELCVGILDLRPRREQGVVLQVQLLDGAFDDVARVVQGTLHVIQVVRQGDRVVCVGSVQRAPNDLLAPETLFPEGVSEICKLTEIGLQLGAHRGVAAYRTARRNTHRYST